MDILELAQRKTQLKKTSSTHGGEWVGPCPACGGRDRFHVWPDKTDSKRSERVGIYWCRGCNKAGDVVQFLVDFDGMRYPEAFAAIGEEMPSTDRHRYAAPKVTGKPAAAPCTLKNDVQAEQFDTWLAKAEALVAHAQEALSGNGYAVKWLKARGIDKETAAGMRLGWLSEDRWRDRSAWGLPAEIKPDGKPKRLWIPGGLVIPMLAADGRARRIRIRRFSEQEPRYVVLPGSRMACMAHGLPNRAAVIVESELDAIMLAGIAADIAAVVALGSASAKPGVQLMDELSKCAVVLVALDSDRAGAEAMRWWKENLPRSRRWPVPQGKDPGEAFVAGVDIREWVMAGLPPGWFFGPSSIGFVTGRRAERGAKDVHSDDEVVAAPVESPEHGPEGHSAAVAETPIEELARLLREHPVEVRVAPDGSRVWIRENQGWVRKNWETSKRISRLVFMDSGCLDYLLNHGAAVINGANFKK